MFSVISEQLLSSCEPFSCSSHSQNPVEKTGWPQKHVTGHPFDSCSTEKQLSLWYNDRGHQIDICSPLSSKIKCKQALNIQHGFMLIGYVAVQN